MDCWYARKHHVAKRDVTATAATSARRYTPVAPQCPPLVSTALRAACTPQLTGLNFEATSIQRGIADGGMRIEEMNINGRPMKLAAAIIDACVRTSSAMPCERPANAIASNAAARKTTSHPSAPP